MAITVKRIKATLWTGNRDDANTNGDVFLGLGGREFKLDLPSIGELQRNTENTFFLGENPNVVDPNRNDPDQDLHLRQEDLWDFGLPYVRFKGANDKDTWNLEAAVVEVTTSINEKFIWRRMKDSADNLWLGNQSGNVCYLAQIVSPS